MSAKGEARKLAIIEMLKQVDRPVALSEIASHFPDEKYRTVGAMTARMVKEGVLDRGPFGKYFYARDKICRKAKHKAVCKFMKSKKTALDISELYDAGFIAGRSV